MQTRDENLVTAMSVKMRAEIVSYGHGELKGKLYSQYLEAPYEFHSMVRMIEKMEEIFDSKKFPQAFMSPRSFRKTDRKSVKQKPETIENPVEVAVPEKAEKPENQEREGANCTFEISVRFRQNATWQGQITWLEKNLKQNFRSVLEMLKLVDEALSEVEADVNPIAWG